MAERASAAQLTSIAKQTAAGTPAVPDKILGAMGLAFQPQTETRITRPSGAKFPTGVVLGREWVTLGVAGEASYPDLAYAFGSAVGNMVDASGLMTFRPNPGAADDVFYLTVRKGDATEGEQTTDAVFNDLGLSFSREAVELSGGCIGKALTMDVAQPTTTALPLTPVDPNDICVYWSQDSTPGAPDKQLRALQGSWGISGRQNPLWVLDCAQSSYVAVVEGATPEVSASLLVEADNQGLSFITALRANNDGWLEFRANEEADPNFLSVLTHAQVSSIGELGDQDGVYAFEVQFTGTTDQTWGTVTETKLKSAGAVAPAMMMGGEQRSSKKAA